jgi:hypothetical protein
MSAIEDPEYPERPFIRMFLSGYDNGAWKDASLNWIEETQGNAVEVIATSSTGKTLALEHTLIELFTGEKYDSTIFVEAFETRIEKNPDLIIPGRALDVMIPVGALVGVKDRDDVGERLLAWMKSNHGNIPVGDSQATVVLGNGLNLTVIISSGAFQRTAIQAIAGSGDATSQRPSTRSSKRQLNGKFRSSFARRQTFTFCSCRESIFRCPTPSCETSWKSSRYRIPTSPRWKRSGMRTRPFLKQKAGVISCGLAAVQRRLCASRMAF